MCDRFEECRVPCVERTYFDRIGLFFHKNHFLCFHIGETGWQRRSWLALMRPSDLIIDVATRCRSVGSVTFYSCCPSHTESEHCILDGAVSGSNRSRHGVLSVPVDYSRMRSEPWAGCRQVQRHSLGCSLSLKAPRALLKLAGLTLLRISKVKRYVRSG